MALQLEHISVMHELERLDWKWEAAGGDEIKCLCPAHAETSPSCTMSINKRLWKCHASACGAKGDIVTFIQLAMSRIAKTVINRATVWADLNDRYQAEDEKTIDMEVVEEHHAAIWRAGTLLDELRKRGVTDKIIRDRRFGFDGERISIPIFSPMGSCVNRRRYLPGAPSADKFKNVRGHGKPRLYPIEQLKFDKIIICGGECKAVVTAEHMNPLGFGAVCLTTGEGKDWSDAHIRAFKGKTVWTMMDIDAGGIAASENVCSKIASIVAKNFIVTLPLDVTKYPKGDVNDFFGIELKSAEDLLVVLETSPDWAPKRPTDVVDLVDESPTIKVHLSDSTRADNAGKRLTIRGMVTMMDETPYLVPSKVKFTCERQQRFCTQCPVYAKEPDEKGSVTLEVPCDSPVIMSMIKSDKSAQSRLIKEAVKMPPCKAVTLRVLKMHNVEDVRVVPQLEIASRAADHVIHPMLYVGKGLELNQGYDFECRVFPAPKSQQALLVSYKSTPAEDSLSTYHETTEQLADLDIFRAHELPIQEKLDEIYTDLSTNVTRIWKRNSMHLAVDLAYHSALLLRVDGRVIKGWVEVLLLGDSSQGKSETASYMSAHYGLGEKFECKNASAAGILGGVVQVGNRHFIQWGVIPTHDKRLVILEELKGASTEIIAKLTDMRSSGRAEIQKIEKRRTHARTRLIAISNPRSDKPLKSYNFGVEAVVELIGGLEDLRRFDLTSLIDQRQVNADEINKMHADAPVIEHRFTSALCKRLILWAWTRTIDQVIIGPDTVKALIHHAIHLCTVFSEEVPIIDRGSTRYKLARLATALAARLFSTDDTRQLLVVLPEHVGYVAKFLEEQYSLPAFGYGDFSRAIHLQEAIKDVDEVKKRIFALPYPKDFVDSMLNTRDIELRDISDWCAWDKGDAISLLSYLVRKHALTREQQHYRKSAAFITLLKDIRDSEALKVMGRPDHIKEVNHHSNNQY